jgi:secondary thiamine-phosphate synthase enzyme
MNSLTIKSQSHEEMIDITSQVRDIISSSGAKQAICLIYIPHTTAGVTINENADPSVKRDMLMALRNAVPDSLPYKHSEGNSPAHVKATLVGPSITVLVSDGKLQLGTWQGIFLCEFDGPRQRTIWITLH